MYFGKLKLRKGSGGGAVGKAAASNTRGLRFESQHRKVLLNVVYCQLYLKDENKEKEAGSGPFLIKYGKAIPLMQ